MSNAAGNIGVKAYLQDSDFFLLDKFSEVGSKIVKFMEAESRMVVPRG